jgi:hypothetical protein
MSTTKNIGFTETLVSKPNRNIGPVRPDLAFCPTLFPISQKINTKYFIPSQLPNITKLQPPPPMKKTAKPKILKKKNKSVRFNTNANTIRGGKSKTREY